VTRQPRWVKWAFLATAILLLDSHPRLGYLIGDVGVLTPLCFATWVGLHWLRDWTRPVFMASLEVRR
jgi:hypothetical protein